MAIRETWWPLLFMPVIMTRYEKLTQYLNILGKSGVIDVGYVASELAKEIGIDPNKAVPKH